VSSELNLRHELPPPRLLGEGGRGDATVTRMRTCTGGRGAVQLTGGGAGQLTVTDNTATSPGEGGRSSSSAHP
jgi:hypothetical protein